MLVMTSCCVESAFYKDRLIILLEKWITIWGLLQTI